MLENEFSFYLEHQTELATQHEGKVLVIKDQKVIGVYNTEEAALTETEHGHKLGTFLIQKCSADPDSVVQTFRSRVRLSGAEVSV